MNHQALFDQVYGLLVSAGPRQERGLVAIHCHSYSLALKIFALLLFAAVTSDLHWLTVWGGVIAEASSLLPVHGIAGASTYEAAFVAGAYGR